MQNFCISAQCSGFWLIFIDFTKCRISASFLGAVDFGWFLLILPNAEFLHLCSVQWILADFYWFYQMQNFCIFAQCSGFSLIFIDFTKRRISASLLSAVDFRWFLLILPNAEFLHLCSVECSGFWLIFIDFTKCRISASLLSAVDFGWFLLILPNAEFLHLCLVQWIFADFYWFYQTQNFCIFAQYSGFWLIFIDFTKCRISASLLRAVDFGWFFIDFTKRRISASLLSAVDFGWFLLILPNAEFLHLSPVQWILADFFLFYQMQNFCTLAQCSGFWLILIHFIPIAEFLHLNSVQWTWVYLTTEQDAEFLQLGFSTYITYSTCHTDCKIELVK